MSQNIVCGQVGGIAIISSGDMLAAVIVENVQMTDSSRSEYLSTASVHGGWHATHGHAWLVAY